MISTTETRLDQTCNSECDESSLFELVPYPNTQTVKFSYVATSGNSVCSVDICGSNYHSLGLAEPEIFEKHHRENTPILKVILTALTRCAWRAIVSVYSYLNHHKKKL